MKGIFWNNIYFSSRKDLFWYLNDKPCKTPEEYKKAKQLFRQLHFTAEELWRVVI